MRTPDEIEAMEAQFAARCGDLDDEAEAVRDALMWALGEIDDENLTAYLPKNETSSTLPQRLPLPPPGRRI